MTSGVEKIIFLCHEFCLLPSTSQASVQKFLAHWASLSEILWLRQAQPPILLLHGAWACWRPFLFLPVISWTSFADFQSVLNHRIIYYYTRCLSLSKAHSHFSSRCLSLSKAHYFYCIKIRTLYKTSLMFLWELKNTIISQNLRGLCVIETPKPNRKIPPTVASTSSATNSFITRCLSGVEGTLFLLH